MQLFLQKGTKRVQIPKFTIAFYDRRYYIFNSNFQSGMQMKYVNAY